MMNKSTRSTLAGAAAAAVLVTASLISSSIDGTNDLETAYSPNITPTATTTLGPTYADDSLPTRTPTTTELGGLVERGDGIILLNGVTPQSWDWRDTIGTWPVRNQYNCAGGWAFATNAVMEAAIAIADVTAPPISPSNT